MAKGGPKTMHLLFIKRFDTKGNREEMEMIEVGRKAVGKIVAAKGRRAR